MRRGPNQQIILNIFDKLKQNLTQNNSINIGNLHSLNVNFDFICKYAKEGFRILTETIHKQKKIILELANIIQNYGLESQISHLNLDLQSNPGLFQLNQNIDEFLTSKNGTTTCKDNSNMSKSSSLNPQKTNYQYGLATKFTDLYLKNMLEYDFQVGIQIPKSAILNTFINWCKQNEYKIDPGQFSIIQMALTNEVKKIFPTSTQTHKSFKGINFKPQYLGLKMKDTLEKQIYDDQDT